MREVEREEARERRGEVMHVSEIEGIRVIFFVVVVGVTIVVVKPVIVVVVTEGGVGGGGMGQVIMEFWRVEVERGRKRRRRRKEEREGHIGRGGRWEEGR